MLVDLNFNLEAWVKKLSIEAASEEEAIQKLQSMTLKEIIDEDAAIDSDMKITEVSTTIVERDLFVRVTDIEYDFSTENMDTAVIDYLKARLPVERTIHLSSVGVEEDIEAFVHDVISDDTGYEVKSCKFQILEQK